MRITTKTRVCNSFKEPEFFSPAVVSRFLSKSNYKYKKNWVKSINNSKGVEACLSALGYDISRQKREAFKLLSLIELQDCLMLPEVKSDAHVSKYMHALESLHDGSLVHERLRLQNLVDKLELKILHSISRENKVLLRAFLRVACLYSNKNLFYSKEDKRVLEELCSSL